MRALGVTRVSVGAQSTNARGLRALGRTHQPEDTAAAVVALRGAGLDVNVDLIFGWPGQAPADWEPVLNEEHDEYRWLPREEAAELLFWPEPAALLRSLP